REQDHKQKGRVGLHARVFERRDLVEGRRQTHHTFTVKVTFTVDISHGESECEFCLQHDGRRLLSRSPQALRSSSCVSSSVSTATAVEVELSAGPAHFEGHASMKFQRSFSSPASFSRMMEPFFRTVFPSSTVCRHFHNSSESVIPRFSVTAENLFNPGSLRTW